MIFGGGSWRAAVRAVLVVLIVMAAAAAAKTIPRGSAQGVQVAATRDSVRVQQRRPFEHRRHERLSCRSCHGTGANHRTILVQTPRDCASCHHDATRAQACRDCHGAGPPEVRLITASLSLTVWDSTRRRVLPFSHGIHAGLVCEDCHRTPVTLRMNRECASCHSEHHRPEATCTTCHVPAQAGVHRESVHLSCAGSGCHASAVAPAPALSRTLCLTCHGTQSAHEPGLACADCHRIPRSAAHPETALPAARGDGMTR